MEKKIIRTQFTRWDAETFPKYNNSEYLEYERVNSDLSSYIISYGYKVIDGTKYHWIKKKKALELLGKENA